MKKKLMAVIICSAMAVSLAACSGASSKETAESSTDEITVSVSSEEDSSSMENHTGNVTEIPVLADQEHLNGMNIAADGKTVEDCVKLAKYKGLELTKDVIEVAEEEVESTMHQGMEAQEVADPDAVLEKGDVADVDYAGTIDGVAFDGGTGNNPSLEIGSGSFIDGFEDGMIGMKAGETKDLNLRFPDDYGAAELAGKDCVFTVTLNKILRYPEMTDEWVAANTEFSTVDEFRRSVREQLEASNEDYMLADLREQAWDKLIRKTQYTAYPREYVAEAEEAYDFDIKATAHAYGYTLEQFIGSAYASQEEYNDLREQTVETYVKNQIVVDLLAEAEGISTDSEEYQKNLAALKAGVGEDIADTFSEYTIEQYLMENMILDKVIEYAEITEQKLEEEAGE